MPRKQYRLEVDVLVSLDDERLTDVKERLEWRVNEMLAVLERKDDVRIDLLTNFEVTEIE
jgi:hypothetical protein